jgi:hypothetical protein
MPGLGRWEWTRTEKNWGEWELAGKCPAQFPHKLALQEGLRLFPAVWEDLYSLQNVLGMLCTRVQRVAGMHGTSTRWHAPPANCYNTAACMQGKLQGVLVITFAQAVC